MSAVRTQLTERVFTANESPSSENIPFHHEMAQVPSPPTHLFFFCEQPPSVHGETPILESSEVCRRLAVSHPVFMEKLERLGVQYVRVLPGFTLIITHPFLRPTTHTLLLLPTYSYYTSSTLPRGRRPDQRNRPRLEVHVLDNHSRGRRGSSQRPGQVI